MAAYVQDIATWTTAAGNKTATITPATGALLVVFCSTSGNIGQPNLADDQGGTYDIVKAATRNASGSGGWAAVRGAFTTNVAHIVTLSGTGADTGGGLDVIEVSGMLRHGTAAVRTTGFKSEIAAGAQPTCNLAQAALTANPVLCCLFAQDNPMTATTPAGYTQRQYLGYNTPASGLGTWTRDSGETTNLITWGGTETSGSGTLAVELDITEPSFGLTEKFTPVPFIPKGRSF